MEADHILGKDTEVEEQKAWLWLVVTSSWRVK